MKWMSWALPLAGLLLAISLLAGVLLFAVVLEGAGT